MPRNFPNWLREYMSYTRFSESPDVYHFWTGVATVAGALQRKVWFDQRIFKWTPNFYIVMVGPAGIAAKSTSMILGLSLLRKVPGIHFGPDSMTWQGLTVALQEASHAVPFGDPNDKLTCEYRDMACIVCDISELGTFLRTDDAELVNVLIDLWDGHDREWVRKIKSEDATIIKNPWIHVIGCTTPTWIKDNIPESMIGGGLISRILFVYADKKRHLAPYLDEVMPEAEFASVKEKLIEDLCAVAKIKGAYELAPDARVWGRDWYKSLWGDRPVHMASQRFDAYISRKQTHVHKLAMVMAAAQRDELVITLDDLTTAARFVTSLEDAMIHVFESIGVVDTAKTVMEMMNIVKVHGKIDQRALWDRCIRIMSLKGFQEATDAAVRAGWLQITQDGSSYIYNAVAEKKTYDNSAAAKINFGPERKER